MANAHENWKDLLEAFDGVSEASARVESTTADAEGPELLQIDDDSPDVVYCDPFQPAAQNDNYDTFVKHVTSSASNRTNILDDQGRDLVHVRGEDSHEYEATPRLVDVFDPSVSESTAVKGTSDAGAYQQAVSTGELERSFHKPARIQCKPYTNHDRWAADESAPLGPVAPARVASEEQSKTLTQDVAENIAEPVSRDNHSQSKTSEAVQVATPEGAVMKGKLEKLDGPIPGDCIQIMAAYDRSGMITTFYFVA
jgi:hypothetical protein